jgi:hypothetical protein
MDCCYLEGGNLMPIASTYKTDDLIQPERSLTLRFEGEDDQSYWVSASDGACLTISKNRRVPQPFHDKTLEPLTPPFRLLAWAFVGLAPAGLGTLVLAPLAALWALRILISRPLSLRDQKRAMIICGIAIALLGIAIPLARLFFTRLSS